MPFAAVLLDFVLSDMKRQRVVHFLSEIHQLASALF